MVQSAGSLAICIQGEVVEELKVGVQPEAHGRLVDCAATIELPFGGWAWQTNILNNNKSLGPESVRLELNWMYII